MNVAASTATVVDDIEKSVDEVFSDRYPLACAIYLSTGDRTLVESIADKVRAGPAQDIQMRDLEVQNHVAVVDVTVDESYQRSSIKLVSPGVLCPPRNAYPVSRECHHRTYGIYKFHVSASPFGFDHDYDQNNLEINSSKASFQGSPIVRRYHHLLEA